LQKTSKASDAGSQLPKLVAQSVADSSRATGNSRSES